MRDPLTTVYGNCVFGSSLDDGWAAFVVPTSTYDLLGEDGKRARFASLLAALHAAQADLQILRVNRRWDVERYVREVRRAVRRDGACQDYVAAQAQRLRELDAQQAVLFVLVSLREPAQDVAAYVSRVAGSHPRDSLRALRRALAPRDRRLLRAGDLEQAQMRAERAQARVGDVLGARPASSAELQWLVRRAFCRGIGAEPAVDGLDEPRALVFERNGEAMLAPLEGDVLRWGSLVPFRWFLLLALECGFGRSWWIATGISRCRWGVSSGLKNSQMMRLHGTLKMPPARHDLRSILAAR